MPTTTLKSVPFRPSSPITGDSSFIYRGENLLLRGQIGNLFYAAYNGSEDMAEPIPTGPITGTFAYSPSSLIVTGSGTKFQDELHLGQMFKPVGAGKALVVSTIESQTSLTLCAFPDTIETSVSAERTPIIFALDTKRGTLWHGNATLTDLGNILAVGEGELRLNGAVLPGDSLNATRRAQIAIYDSSTNTYDVVPLGFDEVPLTVNTDVTVVASGGVKNMSPGYYSLRFAYYSDTTDGYGNPTATLLQGGTDGYHITVANSTLVVDFTDDVGNRPAKATGYITYGSAFGGSSDISKIDAIQGGWFEIQRTPFTSLVSEVLTFEYTDFDLGTLVTFDNDTPPDADWISLFAGYVNLVSADGKGVDTAGRELATSPGPLIAPMKGDNIDAYPASYRVPTEKGETIIGFLNAAGRMFPMTPNTLQASTPTGLPTSPFTLRPFWQRGFVTPYNLTFIDDTLYGFTTKGPYRSIATGDSASTSNDFASSVDAQMATWNPGYVFMETDPKNSAVCHFHSCCSKNEQGYWESEIYPYSLKIFDWMPRILLSDPHRDMIVSGVANVHNNLYFIAGGRREDDTDQWSTWRFDTKGGGDVPYFLAWSYLDSGVEYIGKVLHKLRLKGKFTSAKIQIYAVYPDSDIDINDLMTGDNPIFEMNLDDAITIRQYEVIKCRVKNALMWTVRISGTSQNDGTEESLDSFQELAVDYSISGQMR